MMPDYIGKKIYGINDVNIGIKLIDGTIYICSIGDSDRQLFTLLMFELDHIIIACSGEPDHVIYNDHMNLFIENIDFGDNFRVKLFGEAAL